MRGNSRGSMGGAKGGMALCLALLAVVDGVSGLGTAAVSWSPVLRGPPATGLRMTAGEGCGAGRTHGQEERMHKMQRYAELFSKEVPADLTRLGVDQIAAGEKPWFEKHNEKVALYDKLFSRGTASGEELLEVSAKIRTGRVTRLSEVEGLPEHSVRMGTSFDTLFE